MLLDNYVDCLLEGYELYSEESYAKKYAKIGAGLAVADGAYNDIRMYTNKDSQANLKKCFKKPNKAKMAGATAYGIGASLAARAAAGAVAGAAVGKGRDVYDKIKAKRAAKAKEVAVEEGVSLEEALVFVLECEQDLLNEGYNVVDIYFEDYEIYDEEVDEKERKKANLKKAGIAAGVGAAMAANQAVRDSGQHPEQQLLRKMKKRSMDKAYAKWRKDNNVKCDLLGPMANKEYTDNLINMRAKLTKKGKRDVAKDALKYGAVGAGVGVAAYGAKKLYDNVKAKRAAKAKKVAVEEGVSLEEAFEYVLEMEQMYLNEGYDFTDIYDLDLED